MQQASSNSGAESPALSPDQSGLQSPRPLGILAAAFPSKFANQLCRALLDGIAGLSLLLCILSGVLWARWSQGPTAEYSHARPSDLTALRWQLTLNAGQVYLQVASEQFENDDTMKVLVANDGSGGGRVSSRNDQGWEDPVWFVFERPGFHFKHTDLSPGYGVAHRRQWVIAMPAWFTMLLTSAFPLIRAWLWLAAHGKFRPWRHVHYPDPALKPPPPTGELGPSTRQTAAPPSLPARQNR